jgi:hypothetical protein
VSAAAWQVSGSTPIAADLDLLAAFWDALVIHGEVHEVRIPKTRRGPLRLWGVGSGYFRDRDAFVGALASITGYDAEGVYCSLNPVNPALLARATNRLVFGRMPTTADADVQRLRLLLVDVDPIRPTGISATDDEVAAALAVRDTLRHFLRDEAGWPHPVAVTRSGNGGGLLYRLDLPNDPTHTDLLRRLLAALSVLFSSDAVTIDTTTYNPSRITKVIGSIAAKGDDVPDRPWRLATGRFNTDPQPVSVERLKTVAALGPVPDAPHREAPNGYHAGRDWDVRDLLQAASIGFSEVDKVYATVFKLHHCLTSDDHQDGACILEFPSGALAYRCHHDRCAGKGWAEVRDRLGVSDSGPQHSERSFGSDGTPDGSGRQYAEQAGTNAANASNSAWPSLDPAALHGLAGDIVRTISPHTEGDPVAILANFLTMFGSAVGSTPYAPVGATRHRTNLFIVHVGETARARKGTAHDEVLRLVGSADPGWLGRVMGGLSSGEGLIHAVRDQTWKITKEGKEVIDDPGVEDKRLLAVEPEFSSVLRVASRDGNTLTEVVRRAWDGSPLRTMTRNAPLTATGAHIAILGHITKDELRRELTETSQLNGYANRHLFLCVRRSKYLPHGGALSDEEVRELARRVQAALQTARRHTVIRRDAETNQMWEAVYPALTADRPGMLGAITARAEAQVLRLSLIYALLDGSSLIQRPHLESALAVWQYAEDSARLIFGDATGDPIADRVLSALRANGPMSQYELVDLFGRHLPGAKLNRALEALLAAGKVRSPRVETGGRPRTVWRAVP